MTPMSLARYSPAWHVPPALAERGEGWALVRKLGVTPTAPAGDSSEANTALDSLNAMPRGAAWDKAYIDYEVGYYQAVIDIANRALAATQNDSLEALIRTAVPIPCGLREREGRSGDGLRTGFMMPLWSAA